MLQVQQQAFKQLLDREHMDSLSKQQPQLPQQQSQQQNKRYEEANSSIIG